MAAESILRNSSSTSNAPAAPPVNQRHLQVALHHANMIQDQKAVENRVLDAIITLLDFPTSSSADPAKPSPADALRFKELLVPFTPSDYDSLIEERNIADKCGYALCPRPKKKLKSKAKLHFVDGDKGLEIKQRKELEVWCSDDCLRRAAYVKVQLNEEPAWLRRGGISSDIELKVDNTEEHHKALPLRLKHSVKPPTAVKSEEEEVADAWAAMDNAMADLAVERGEKPGRLSKANAELLKSHIKERVVTSKPPVPPSLNDQLEGQSRAIEGHVPKADAPERVRQQGKDDSESGSEEDDGDWDKSLPV